MDQQSPHQRATEQNENSTAADNARPVGIDAARPLPPSQPWPPNAPSLSQRPSTSQQATSQPLAFHDNRQNRTTALVRTTQQESTQQCPACGAIQPTSTSICLTCGNYLPSKAARIRCRHCGTQSSASLVLCPGCGRELHAARTRSFRWVMPVIFGGLCLLLILQWRTAISLRWPGEQLATGWQWVVELGAQLDPQITIETIPGESAQTLAANPAPGISRSTSEEEIGGGILTDLSIFATPTDDGTTSLSGAVEPLVETETAEAETAPIAPNPGENLPEANSQENRAVEADLEPTSSVLQAAAPTMTPTTAPTPRPTATTATANTPTAQAAVLAPTPRPTPTRFRPTATATQPTPVVNITATSRPTLTAEGRTTGEVEAATADRSSAIGAILKATATNTTTTAQATAIPPSATALPPTATQVPPTATPTVAAIIYKIQPGDTPLEIAGRYDIGVLELLTANGLTTDDARRLRVGQELIIPQQGQSPESVASPTPIPTRAPATATVQPPTATATIPEPTATAATTIRLDVPQLRSPEDGSFLSCGGNNSLIWLPVDFMREDDRYLLHLGFLNGYNTDGTENVVWILEQQQPANASIWRMDEALCSLAPQDFGRQWRWYVEVVAPTDSGQQPVSLPSSIWTFSWN